MLIFRKIKYDRLLFYFHQFCCCHCTHPHLPSSFVSLYNLMHLESEGKAKRFRVASYFMMKIYIHTQMLNQFNFTDLSQISDFSSTRTSFKPLATFAKHPVSGGVKIVRNSQSVIHHSHKIITRTQTT